MDGSSRFLKRKAERVGQRDAFKVTPEFIQFGADWILPKVIGTVTENVVSKENMQDEPGLQQAKMCYSPCGVPFVPLGGAGSSSGAVGLIMNVPGFLPSGYGSQLHRQLKLNLFG